MSKIGLGIITCNREDFYKQCYDSVPFEDVDVVVTVNDGDKLKGSYPLSNIITHSTNKGVGISKNEAIILSMTKKERENPKIIDGSRRKRIANGSGTDVATINKLLKQFKMMSEMMKKMSKGNLKGMSDKGIPPELFNQLK